MISDSRNLNFTNNLIFHGGAAFSGFRLQKLLSKLQNKIANLSQLNAKYVYFIDVKNPLSNEQEKTLQHLLPNIHSFDETIINKSFILVIPRFGTISPWSTKATDIAHVCGLENINRIERGIIYSFSAKNHSITPEALLGIADLLHDRMTETVLFDFSPIKKLFISGKPKPLKIIDVLRQGEAALIAANQELGLALTSEEITYLVKSFQTLERNPTDVELMMFAQVNSEHCRHKIFNARWIIDGKEQAYSLFDMIRNTYNKNSQGVLSAYKDNAAILIGPKIKRFFPDAVTKNYSYCDELNHTVIKVETHNHPTAISPFPGAATGAGGEIRDEGAAGRGAKPKAGLTGFSVSNLNIPNYLQPWEINNGKPLHMAAALEIMLEGPIGAASFNNEFGRPNLCGYFRTLEIQENSAENIRGYHKPIMIAGGLGNIRPVDVEKQSLPIGAKLIVLGGPAMRIGLGGGAASSKVSDGNNIALDFASVQRSNPEMQRRCQEVIDACWALGEKNPIFSIHDVGAGGLSNALPELVHGSERGGNFLLNAIPVAEADMSPLEIWCNEAQERYVLAIRNTDLNLFNEIAERERCPFAVVGEVTEEQKLLLSSYADVMPAKAGIQGIDTQCHPERSEGSRKINMMDPANKSRDDNFSSQSYDCCIDLPLNILFNKPPKMLRNVKHEKISHANFTIENIDIKDAVRRILQFPAVASKSFLITIGDRSVGGLTARDQMIGPWQIPVADVAVTASGFNTYYGEAMAMGERTPLALLNSAAAARIAVGESITNIAAAAINNISEIRLSANWMAAAGAPGEDAALYDAVKAVGLEFCPALGICIPVGKDSLSMRSVWQENGKTKIVTSPVSLIISAFAPVNDIRKTLTPQLITNVGATDLILIDLGTGKNRLGGSALAQVYQQLGNEPPDVDNPELLKSFFTAIQELNKNNLLLAYHDRSDGGLFVTLCEMMFAGHTGITIQLDNLNVIARSTSDEAIQKENAGLLRFARNDIGILFCEELGAVIQIRKTDRDAVMQLLKNSGLQDCVHIIGTLNQQDQMLINHKNKNLFTESRINLQQLWSETSYRMQALRDNPQCAEQEFSQISDPNNSGLRVNLSFNHQENIVAPYINKNTRPKMAILREQGVNGHIEMAAAFDRAGFISIDVHMSDIISGKISLKDFKGLAACGGFSYGDVLGAGQGWAKSILLNARAKHEFSEFFNRKDSFALGICNGCQMFSNLTGLIPGSELWPRFTRNLSEQFEARFSMVEIPQSPSIFFQDMAGSQLPITVSHGEGKAEFMNNDQLEKLLNSHTIALHFIDNFGKPTENYPANPNGSSQGISGLTTTDGRVTILMPHPERVFRATQWSWHPNDWQEDSPWMRMFYNARKWVR